FRTEVLADATGAIHLANAAGSADAETVHTTLMTLLNSNWAAAPPRPTGPGQSTPGWRSPAVISEPPQSAVPSGPPPEPRVRPPPQGALVKFTHVRNATAVLTIGGTRILIDPMLGAK